MKTVQFTNIHLEHFGKHENIQSKLGHRTVIGGANATGKSTIKRAIQYILGTKDENGKEISGIRPHDENGVDIDGLTTVAELTVSVDGTENTLKRTCFQEKNRQGEYTGKDNLQYFVDDVKKGTKKAYDEFVSAIIPATVCISAQELLMKDTAGRRAMLEVFSKHDTDSIIDENSDFEPLRGRLGANTVADLKSAWNEKIYGKGKGSNHVDGLVDKRKKIEHQIEFENSQKVDIDLAELELHRNALNEQIAENKAKQANVDKQFEEYDRQSKDILDLQFELNDLERKANEENNCKRRELNDKIVDLKYSIDKIIRTIRVANQEIAKSEESIKNSETELQEVRDLWKKTNDMQFDKGEENCQMCGQRLPQGKIETLISEFEKKKDKTLANITDRGNRLKKYVLSEKEVLEKLKAGLANGEKEKVDLETQLKELEAQYNALPQSIDISDREDVKQLKQQIAEKEQAMQKCNSASEIRQQLQEEYESLSLQVAEVVGKINLSVKNDAIDERVAELKKQQLVLSQEIADVERELDLLKQFERKKAELLESDVNENFDLVQFCMFEQQQNGDLKDVCLITVDGESYDRNLNFSNRLLAEADICRGFQRKYDVELPILLDNAESIDNDKIPNVSNQLILFMRSDNKELKIETEV